MDTYQLTNYCCWCWTDIKVKIDLKNFALALVVESARGILDPMVTWSKSEKYRYILDKKKAPYLVL